MLVSPDLDLPKLPEHDPFLPETQIVERIDVSDQSISPAMRGRTSLEEIEQDLAAFLRWDRAKTAAERMLKAGSAVDTALRKIADGLDDQNLREHFLSTDISETELLEVLRYASSEQRLELLGVLKDIAEYDPDIRDFMASKLDNVLKYYSLAEKTASAELFFKDTESDAALFFVGAICKNSRDFEELAAVVDALNADKLAAQGGGYLKEYAAHTVLGRQIRSLLHPTKLKNDASLEDVGAALENIQETLQKILDICGSDERFADTAVARDFKDTAITDLASLFIEADRLKAPLDHGETPEELERRRTALCGLANVLTGMMDIEFCYGINLTQEFDSETGLFVRRWSEQDIADISEALSRISEGKLLFTPHLKQIERVADLGPYTLGARYGDGTVRIADLAVDHEGISKQYGGYSSLQVVLTHELGHSLQMGATFGSIMFDGESGFFVSEGDPIYDFDEFVKISGWQPLDPSRYEMQEDGLHVKIDGELYPVNTPVELDGQKVVLTPYWDILFAFKADSEFSSRWYSRVSPWEDFAEAFCEYYLTPERLIDLAPHKFIHLEHELGRYKDSDYIKALLEKRLADGVSA